jgi:heat shock protein HslJ
MNLRFLSAEILGIGACCLVFLLAGCASKPTRESPASGKTEDVPTAASLAGTEWLLEDLAGAGVLDNAQATLSFPKEFATEGKISGSGSCNRFSGSATINSGSIQVGPLAATRMACVPAVDDQETRYLKALQGAERLAFNGPYLLLYAKGLEKPLRFIKNSGK